MTDDPRIGSQIGPYRIVSVLGRGGMGVVYLAEHVHLERPVALKVLAEQLAHDATGSAFQVVEGSGSVWVTNGITAVIRVDPDTNKVVDTISTKGGSFDVAGGFGSIWVTNAGSNTLSRIDVASGKVTNVLRVGVSPRLMAVGPEGLWVANGDSRSVSLVHP